MSAVTSLWAQLLGLLDNQGLLPIQFNRMTPAEIANHVLDHNGDERVVRFVWNYYYPRNYGNIKGLLSDKKARALVESFLQPQKQTSESVSNPALNKPKRVMQIRTRCQVCQVRWPAEDIK